MFPDNDDLILNLLKGNNFEELVGLYMDANKGSGDFGAQLEPFLNSKTENRHSVLFVLSRNEDCPICESKVFQKNTSNAEAVCHSCGLEGSMNQGKQHYHLQIEDISWDVSTNYYGSDDLQEIRKNQEEVFAIYRSIIKGDEVEDVEQKLEALKQQAEALSAPYKQ